MTAPVGRPTEYHSHYCDQLVDHMSQGFSYESFSAVIGTCRSTLYNWEKSHPEFLDAKKRAFDACQLRWESMCIDTIFESKGLNTPAWIFNMKNRFGWKDKQDGEENTSVTVNVNGLKKNDN